MLSVHSYPRKSEQGSVGTGSIPQSTAPCAAATQPLTPRAAQTSRSKELRKNESTTLIQYRKIAMTVVLSSFFQENNNKRRRKETKKKKKQL